MPRLPAYCEFHRHASVRKKTSFKAGKHGLFVIGHVENRQQLCDSEQFPDFLCQIQKLELPAFIDNGGIGTYQFANSRAVDIIYIRKIENDLFHTGFA